MKALSLTQPWASLVAIGAKKVETRSWSTSYRGLIAIHAAKGFPAWARETCSEQPFLRALTRAGLSMPELPLGVIVATARLVHIVSYSGLWDDSRWHFIAERHHWPFDDQERAFGDYGPGRFAWLLGDLVPLRQPIPCRGALGLWDVPPEIAAQIAAATEQRSA